MNRQVNIYVNGSLVKSGSMGINAGNTLGEFIGCSSSTGTSCSSKFTGNIDDVRLYNRALSATEIKSLYNQGR
ncbi:MAG: hypothetical protein B7X03_03915 [Parcubacteria group bacterium 21-58-10]|nr:MAG: hypothetical protein B7X03_03915 [Parcubacteria group bacterium 21-58-10]